MKRSALLLSLSVFMITLFSAVVLPSSVSAATAANCGKESSGLLSFPTWYKYLNPRFVDGECKIDFTIPADVGPVLLAVFEIILRVGSMVAIGFVIFGGFQYILSQGEPERTKGARSTIINALIGLVITVFATAIVNVIARNIA